MFGRRKVEIIRPTLYLSKDEIAIAVELIASLEPMLPRLKAKDFKSVQATHALVYKLKAFQDDGSPDGYFDIEILQ